MTKPESGHSHKVNHLHKHGAHGKVKKVSKLNHHISIGSLPSMNNSKGMDHFSLNSVTGEVNKHSANPHMHTGLHSLTMHLHKHH